MKTLIRAAISRIKGLGDRLAASPWLGLVLTLALVALVVIGDEALARSGGSGGGGGFSRSFGGGGGGFSGGGGGFSGGRGFGLYGCYFMDFQTMMIIVAVILVVGFVQKLLAASRDKARVYRVRVGIGDPGPRPWNELEALVRRSAFDSPEGLAAFARQVAIYLRRQGNRVSHVSLLTSAKLNPPEAERTFQSLASEARSVFNREVLRVEGRGRALESKREAERKDALLDEDGDFGINEFFVVTLIVGVDAGQPALPDRISSREDLGSLLDRLGGLGAPSVLAAEVSWTPAAESDIMTADELLTLFPELTEIG